jgi:hypothetical protein
MQVNDIGLGCLMTSARHTTLQHAATYLQDALTRYARSIRAVGGFPKGDLLSPFESLFSESQSVRAESEWNEDGSKKKTIIEVVDWWYESLVGNSSSSPDFDCFSLLKAAVSKTQKVKTTPTSESLEKLLLSIALNPDIDDCTKSNSIKSYLEKLMAHAVQPQASSKVVQTTTWCGDASQSESKKRRMRGGSVVISERDCILGKDSTPAARIAAVKTAFLGNRDSLQNLAVRDLSFFHRSINKPGKCLTECHQGEESTFLMAYPDFKVASKFKCSCGPP